ncbi:MAG: hypothetical protein AB2421_14250 [Thermotaleaceae bacterium]
MEIQNKYFNRMMGIVLVSLLALSFFSNTKLVYGKENEGKVSIEAYYENNNIVVSVTPEKKAGSSFNTMDRTQIWGDYGRGWFLIKDYNASSQNEQEFRWDLKTLDDNNEGGARAYLGGNTERLKLYVRCKNTTPGNSDKMLELFKTFYLGGAGDDLQLTSNHESEKDRPVGYDFPLVVTQGQGVQLYLDSTANPDEDYIVKIEGDNYSKEIENKKNPKGKRDLKWTPEESGTFYIAVYNKKSQLVLKRKVYVNSKNKQYLQLEDLAIDNENDSVWIRLKVAGSRPTGFSGEVSKSLRLSISEPYVWSRTIKDYGDTVAYNPDQNTYEINEKRERFTLGSGRYFIGAAIKTPHSVEYDDRITKAYEKKGPETVAFEVDFHANREPESNGSYALDGSLKFEIKVKNPQEGYEYSFFLEDARGKRCVKNYSDRDTFTWMPADSGTYKIYARIRQKEKLGSLPNSYLKEVCIPISVGELHKKIEILQVQIDSAKWTIVDGKVTKVTGNGKIKAHELNRVEIDAQYKNTSDRERLMYKIAIVSKGHYSYLAPYSFSRVIPFYPKNTGPYRLMVMVKDATSGSYEDYCEILVDVRE